MNEKRKSQIEAIIKTLYEAREKLAEGLDGKDIDDEPQELIDASDEIGNAIFNLENSIYCVLEK